MSEYRGFSFAFFLLLAIALHLPLFFIARKLPLRVAEKMREIVVEPLTNSDKPLVQTSRSDEASDEKARFSGEFRNRVSKQMQSRHRGRFRQGDKDRIESDKEGMAQLMPFSRTPNALPGDIESGDQTLLNTDPVLYASFINRIADEVYDPWVKFARQAISDVYHRGRKLEPNTFITKLMVNIDREGEVNSIQILQSSGIAELDEAPKKAFWESEPFPNPPTQMFENEMSVGFVYEFHFEWRTSSFNIVPWAI